MTKEEIKNCIHQMLQSIDENNLEKWKSFYAESLQYHLTDMPTMSREEYSHFLNSMNNVFSGFHHTVFDLFAEQMNDDTWGVSLRFQVTSTHIPTGKSVTGTGMIFFHLHDGKIIEQWDNLNMPKV